MRRSKGVVLIALGLVAATMPARSQRPATPAVQAPSTTTYEVGGVRVIHRHSPGNIVVANLYLLGGVRQVSWENAGIELLLLNASERGTRSYTRERLRRTMAMLGTSIEIDAGRDWTMFGIRATRPTFDSTWAVMASRLMEPVLEGRELELVKQQFILAVRQREDSPDALLEFLADSAAFAGHPYAIPPAGTATSLAGITPEALRRYHADQVVRSRMLLVVVGNVTREHVERLVARTLARLPAGSYRWTLPDTLPRRRASVHPVGRELPTNYITGRYPGPAAGTPDYYALRMAAAVIGGQLFAEIRSRRNLTYAVDAPFLDRAVSSGGFYVTTVSPQVVVDLMRQQLAAVRTGIAERGAMARLKQQFLTQYFLDNETNSDQADALAQSHLFEGDFTAAANLEEKLRAVTPDDIQRVARVWMRDVQWVYIGALDRLPRASMERF
ncbi:MAG: M16 family metallopeptidase [Gemmatimonadota bacterium]